jgi:AraC-like DNA-binding protein/tetratricopeptide (TPR) repeat protein
MCYRHWDPDDLAHYPKAGQTHDRRHGTAHWLPMDQFDLIATASRTQPLPQDLRRAVAHLRENMTMDNIGMPQLVKASGMSQRTLHRQFRRILGTTPLAYLRLIRLVAAHDRLMEPDSGSVSDIAVQVGCTHLGRFAADYRRRFGQLPSATRQQARDSQRMLVAPLAAPPGRDRPSLLLLPLRTETVAERLVAEDMHEQIAATLTKSHVASVHLASSYDAPRVQRNLHTSGARYCLTGRLRLAGDNARVTMRLIDVSTDRHVWGDSFDGCVAEFLTFEDHVTDAVLCGVVAGIAQSEIEDVQAKPAEGLEARDLMVRALRLTLVGDVPSARQVLALTARVMENNPSSAPAVALAAFANIQLVLFHGTEAPSVERSVASDLTERAGMLDTGDPLVTTARAAVAIGLEREDEADVLVTRALAMDPTHAWAWRCRGALRLLQEADPDLAIANFRRALQLQGARAPRASVFSGISYAHRLAGRFDEGVRWMNRALVENPNATHLHKFLVFRAMRAGDHVLARRSLDRLRRAHPDLTVGAVAACHPSTRPDCLEMLARVGLPV